VKGAAFDHCLAALLCFALAACASTGLGTRTPAAPAGSGPAHPSEHTRTAGEMGSIMTDAALSMLGQPYRFGGAAPGGFDCSGLVEYAAKSAGVAVPRTAHEQLRFGYPVARGDLRAGDLVFMHLAHKELHVGIAIGGERFVHAPSKGGRVRVDSLAAPPYSQGFTGARRIIPAS
jgi:cell wall-associated NlpC family hydrolase